MFAVSANALIFPAYYTADVVRLFPEVNGKRAFDSPAACPNILSLAFICTFIYYTRLPACAISFQFVPSGELTFFHKRGGVHHPAPEKNIEEKPCNVRRWSMTKSRVRKVLSKTLPKDVPRRHGLLRPSPSTHQDRHTSATFAPHTDDWPSTAQNHRKKFYSIYLFRKCTTNDTYVYFCASRESGLARVIVSNSISIRFLMLLVADEFYGRHSKSSSV